MFLRQKEPAEDTRFFYTYEIAVHNSSPKVIREIDWDYVFTDSETGEELGRRQFTSVDKIGADKKKKLVMRVHTPPTRSTGRCNPRFMTSRTRHCEESRPRSFATTC